MAVSFLSTANAILSSQFSSLNPSSSTSSSSLASCSLSPSKAQGATICLCKAFEESWSPSSSSKDPTAISKRNLSLSLTATLLLSFTAGNGNVNNANAAILEADDDLELLERVKKDRKKRIEKQGVISSAKKETGYLQDLVYKLSEVGQAIEKNDLGTASSVLGPSTDTEWIKKANSAFSKLTSSPEEKEAVDIFNTSMAKLISSVDQKDMELSKIAFVSSATAFEKWTSLTGLVGQLKGL